MGAAVPDTGHDGRLSLGTPENVTEIAFAARTDDNEIRQEDTCQLYYWHDGWQPLWRWWWKITDQMYR